MGRRQKFVIPMQQSALQKPGREEKWGVGRERIIMMTCVCKFALSQCEIKITVCSHLFP